MWGTPGKKKSVADMSKCLNCEDAEALLPDPNDVVLDVGERVLCRDCFINAVDDAIADKSEEIAALERLKGRSIARVRQT